MSFIPEYYLKEAIEEKNIRNIRVSLSTYITKDPGNCEGEIKRAVEYVEENFGTIWEKHDGKKEEPKEKWNIEYIGMLQSNLMMNFSKERFKHILEVGQTLYPKIKVRTITEKRKIRKDISNKNILCRSDKKNKNTLGKFIAAGIVIIGGICICWKK